jgi:hypothetical protein
MTRWISSYFTADNAVLAVGSQSPGDLELHLPRGRRVPAPVPGPRVTPTPAVCPANVSTVSVSAEVPRGRWAGMVAWLMERRLMARLRYQDGVTYGVQTGVERCGADVNRVIVSIDALPGRLPDVASVAVDVLETLARQGPTADELQAWCALLASQEDHPQRLLAELASLAESTLLGLPLESPGSLLRQAGELSPDDVRRTFWDLGSTMLWMVPPGVSVPGVPAATGPDTTPVQGTTFRPPNGQLQTRQVTVSPEALRHASTDPDDPGAVTIRWSQCAALLAYPDGARSVIGADGYVITLLPESWHRYDELRAAVDGCAPPQSWCPQTEVLQRGPVEPLMVEKQVTSNVAWLVLSVVCLFFGLLMFLSWETAPLGLVFLALGAWPAVVVWRRARRQRSGAEKPAVRQYRGVLVWPTQLVGAVAVLSGVLLVVGVASVTVPLILVGVVLGGSCVAELVRRRTHA